MATVATFARRSPLTIGIKTFEVHRYHDIHGNSGTGIVAEGVIFSSGKCVLQWLNQVASVAMFDSLDEVIAIHGHGGKTVVLLR
jgi:hypothetical protein